jgi:hypothetical protein
LQRGSRQQQLRISTAAWLQGGNHVQACMLALQLLLDLLGKCLYRMGCACMTK